MRWYLPRPTLVLLIVAQLGAVLPNWSQVGPVLVVLNLFCLAWCAGICLGRFGQPPRWLLVTLALGGAGALAITLPGKGLYLAMVSLLVLGYSLKVLEIKAPRDLHALVLFGLFLLATDLVRYQSMAMTLYLLLAALVQLAVLLSLFGVRRARHLAATLGRMSLLSLPLMLLLFLLLPRLGPLWKMPDAGLGSTGLSDSLSPGDISKLAQSTALAFRAELPWHPNGTSLYWRALTLEVFDGRAWHQADFRKSEEEHPARPKPPQGRDWRLMSEPSSRPWLPVLDGSLPLSPGLGYTGDRRVVADKPLARTESFRLRLATPARGRELPGVLAINKLLPPQGNPRARALAQTLRHRYKDDAALAAAVNSRFADSAYHYSLAPPALPDNVIDRFLFETHTGFCGHYASAMAFLLRAAGIPARVVAGYQGGQYSPEGDFYALYQYDAHAWVEAWLPATGWTRFDPTAQVSPERIDRGFEGLASDPAFSKGGNWLWRLKQQPALRWLRYQAALMDYRWQRWVLNYDSGRRDALLSALLGTSDWLPAALLFGGLLLAFLLALHWWSGRDRRPATGPAARLYLKGCKRLGLARRAGESPEAYALRVADSFPALASQWNRVTGLYQQLRYGGADPGRLDELKRLVRALPRSARIAP
ncbi:DUF3488 and transglutaminase-like domain-containing protein [Gallaecimonas kandeliae]|uniref:transglutaminase TgpA family protein n=1 Tax=Gallaecimonas kandeliae TaxID=3029055 RepID=UPI00264A1D90|nr:DUF3488 and transglutaminase-like domain-containing protein [Gallaecimonas kandeliae]WKE65237.1 DUF3488 and transglutaminase-like domain-containing protein [Gallaecimonas kandeliae]